MDNEKSLKMFFEVNDINGVEEFTIDPPTSDIRYSNHTISQLSYYLDSKDGLNDIVNLFQYINTIYHNLKRPLIIGFDISSCPRVVFLRILNFCISNNIVEKISFFYSEGEYVFTDPEKPDLTDGEWVVNKINGYEGKGVNIKKDDYYIISFGFDQLNYQNWVDECEKLKKIGVLLPTPGYKPEYDSVVKSKLNEFKEKFTHEDYYECIQASAGDAIEAWQKLHGFLSNNNDLNITFLPYGPKPHSLAMGIKCLVNRNIILTYRTSSKGYNKIDVSSNGKIWRYDIKNLLLA